MLINDIKDGNKKILITNINGLSISLGEVLTEYGNDVVFFENNDFLSKNYKDIATKPLDIINSLEYDFSNFDYIIISKKLKSDSFEMNNLIAILNKLADRTYTIIEIICNLYPNKCFIHIIDETYRSLVYPILQCIYKENSVNNIILSSLEDESEEELKSVDISAVEVFMVGDYNRNFTKNLDFDVLGFFDLQNEIVDDYIKNLFLKQNQNSKAFINTDNEYLKEFYKNISKNSGLSSKIIEISVKKLLENGYSYVNDSIYCYIEDNKSYDLVENNYTISTIGKVSILASFAIATNTGQKADITVECLKKFHSIPNIIEYVAKVDNIKFINNISAITNEILISPFETYSNIYAIFVTNGRQNNFFKIKNYTKNIKKIFLVDMFDCVDLVDDGRKINIKKYKNLNEAFTEAIKNIKGDTSNNLEEATVLLSPIVSDRINVAYYRNYGIKFKKLIEAL